MDFRRVDVKACDYPRAFSSPAIHIIQDSAELRAVYGEEFARGVNLRDWFVIGVHRGLCRSGGYSVKVQDIKRGPEAVTVTVQYRDPEPGEVVTLMMTEPSDIVLVSRKEFRPGERIEFGFQDQYGIEIDRREVIVSQAGG
ncbi:MAG: protease complex subunit PrcB family protein [Ignavibacteriales bacterium]